jgi:hypothetical protein
MPAAESRLISFSALSLLWNTPACTVNPRLPAGSTPAASAVMVCSGVGARGAASLGGGTRMTLGGRFVVEAVSTAELFGAGRVVADAVVWAKVAVLVGATAARTASLASFFDGVLIALFSGSARAAAAIAFVGNLLVETSAGLVGLGSLTAGSAALFGASFCAGVGMGVGALCNSCDAGGEVVGVADVAGVSATTE